MSREWTYTINAPEKWLNANDRSHRKSDNMLVQEWKTRSSGTAIYMRIPRIECCRLTATLFFPDNRRRDSGNYYPSIKAAVDGIVRAGVLDDDDDKHVLSLTIQRGVFDKEWHGPKGALGLLICEVTS